MYDILIFVLVMGLIITTQSIVKQYKKRKK